MHHLSEGKCGRVEEVIEVRPELKKKKNLSSATYYFRVVTSKFLFSKLGDGA